MKKDLLNLSSLTCIQASNALVPLIMFPFLLYTLGSSKYADLVLGEALALLVLSVVIFSFEIIGISDLVRFREIGDKRAINILFSSVLYIRLLLFAIMAPLAIGFYTIILGNSILVIALWMLVPLAYILQSAWLYQGFEENFPLAGFTLVSRIGSLGLIILVIKGDTSPYLVPAIVGSTYLFGGLLAFGYAMMRHGLRLHLVGLHKLVSIASNGKEIFFTNIAVSMQRDLNVLILGIVGIPAQSIAAYSIAEKLTKSLQAIARPVNQLFFPKTIRAIKNDVGPSCSVARKIFRHTVPQVALVLATMFGLLTLYLMIIEHTSLRLPYDNLNEIFVYLSIMAPTIVFGIGTFMFGSVGLNYLGDRRYLFMVIFITGTVSALVCITLSAWIGAYAAAISYASAEVVTLLVVLARYARRSSKVASTPN